MTKRKTIVREEMKRVLGALDERWITAAGRELCGYLSEFLKSYAEREIDSVLAWASFFPGEADLSSFIVRHLDEKKFYLPRASPDRSMTFLRIDKDWSSEQGNDELGIPAPGDTAGDFYDTNSGASTMILVPGLAFDHRGNRLGRGKGYYDRFLSRPGMARALKVGVCWKLQIVNDVPTSPHDVPMDWIVTEEGIVRTEASRIVISKFEHP